MNNETVSTDWCEQINDFLSDPAKYIVEYINSELDNWLICGIAHVYSFEKDNMIIDSTQIEELLKGNTYFKKTVSDLVQVVLRQEDHLMQIECRIKNQTIDVFYNGNIRVSTSLPVGSLVLRVEIPFRSEKNE